MSSGLVVTLDDLDVTCHAFAPLHVEWGREHPGDSYEPRRATVTFDDVANPRRGQTVVAQLQDPTTSPTWAHAVGHWNAQVGTWDAQRANIILFRGRITDTTDTWELVHVDGEAVQRWGALVDVTAVDPLAELANTPVGDVPWPQESVSARAARIEALTALAWTTDPSAVVVAARDVDAQPAYDLLDDLAHMASLAGGVIYDPNTKTARFLLGAQRNSLVPTIVLDACSIGADAQAVVAVSDVVNDVTVTYVNPADPTGQPSAHYSQPGSVNINGRRTRTISTELVSGTDAMTRAQAEATRYGTQVVRWESVKVGTKYGPVSTALAKALINAGPSTRVQLTTLPAPADPTWDGYVEGWALDVDADSWEVTLDLSPATWSGPLITWAQVPTGNTGTRWCDIRRPWQWSDALSQLPTTIANPGFESPWTPQTFPTSELPDGYPTGWETFWIIGARQVVRKGPAQAGATGLQWGPTAAGAATQRFLTTAWPVVAGAQVDVGLWVKSGDGAHLVSIELDVMTAPHSNPGPFQINTINQAALAATVTTAGWVFYSGHVIVPAGHTFARFSPVLTAPAGGGYVGQIDAAQAQ